MASELSNWVTGSTLSWKTGDSRRTVNVGDDTTAMTKQKMTHSQSHSL
jgi:hypothetical protein